MVRVSTCRPVDLPVGCLVQHVNMLQRGMGGWNETRNPKEEGGMCACVVCMLAPRSSARIYGGRSLTGACATIISAPQTREDTASPSTTSQSEREKKKSTDFCACATDRELQQLLSFSLRLFQDYNEQSSHEYRYGDFG